MKKSFTLDLRKFVCPVTFIKTRAFLKKCPHSAEKFLLVSSKKTLNELINTFKDLEIKFSVEKTSSSYFKICIKP